MRLIIILMSSRGRAWLVSRAALTLTVGLLALPACSTSSASPTPSFDDDARPAIMAAFYPLEYVAQRVGGDRVTVASLTPPGVEPHELELSPVQVSALADSTIALYIAGFQAAVDDAIAIRPPAHLIDAADGPDPHIWLDPSLLEPVTKAIAAQLATADPAGAETYLANAADLTADLAALDSQYRQGLTSCTSRLLVTTHEAFGHLATRYGLEQLAIVGLDPETEPSLARLRQVSDQLAGQGVTTVFFENQASPAVAQAVADEIGATTGVLDPIEVSDPAGGDYFSRMRDNLQIIQTALGCER